MRTSILMLLFLCFLNECYSNIIFVNGNASGNNDGTTWEDAFNFMDEALAVANIGDEIWVAQGIYVPYLDISFNLKSGVALYGGFSGSETQLNERNWTSNVTILSGEISDVETSPNVVFCQNTDSTTLLDGFNIAGGCACPVGIDPNECTLFSLSERSCRGGGIYLYSPSINEPVFLNIKNCTFENNYAKFGGGICVNSISGIGGLNIANCHFVSNKGSNSGGAVMIQSGNAEQLGFMIDDSYFEENEGYYNSGAIYFENFDTSTVLSISNCFFNNNSAFYNNGALGHTSTGKMSKIKNCVFSNNHAGDNQFNPGVGGAVFGSNMAFLNCTFNNNRAFMGGAINGVGNLFANSLFYDNFATTDGGVMRTGGGDSFQSLENTFINCTFFGNRALGRGGFLYNIENSTNYINNCLFWNNTAVDQGDFIYSYYNLSLIVQNSLIDEINCDSLVTTLYPQMDSVFCSPSTMFNLYPFFIDTINNNYQLLPCSPARNKGDNNLVDTTMNILDVNGNNRINDNIIDIGAFESSRLKVWSDSVMQIPCSNLFGTINIVIENGCAPFDINWGVDSAFTLVNEYSISTTAGIYLITVTDGTLASDTITVEIKPSLNLIVDTSPIHCFNSSDGIATVTPISGTAPFTWLWQTGDTTATVDSLSGGSYSVIVTDASGCTDELDFTMNSPSEIMASIDVVQPACFGEPITATASATGGTGNFSYAWDNGAMTAVTNLLPGSHTVTATDEHGCMGTASVLITAPPALQADIVVQPPVLCFGASNGTLAILPSGGTPPYSWSGPTENLPTGSYEVTITDSNGCTVVAEATIAEHPEITVADTVADASSPTAADGGITLTSVTGGTGSGYTFLWNNGAASQNLTNVPTGDYTVTVTDSQGCTASFTFFVDFNSAAGEAGANPFGAAIVPNPSGSGGARLVLERPLAQFSVRVFDAQGRLVHEQRADLALPRGLAAGTYQVVLERESKRAVLKWVVGE